MVSKDDLKENVGQVATKAFLNSLIAWSSSRYNEQKKAAVIADIIYRVEKGEDCKVEYRSGVYSEGAHTGRFKSLWTGGQYTLEIVNGMATLSNFVSDIKRNDETTIHLIKPVKNKFYIPAETIRHNIEKYGVPIGVFDVVGQNLGSYFIEYEGVIRHLSKEDCTVIDKCTTNEDPGTTLDSLNVGQNKQTVKGETAMSEFDAGKKIRIEFSKKLIISSKPVDKKAWDEEKQTYLPVTGKDGQPEKDTETRIKLPMSSEYRGFIFTTTEPLRNPHKFKFDKEQGKNIDLGPNENLNSVQLYENVEYKITRTPYIFDMQGNPAVDEKTGHKRLDFENQETVKLTGSALKKEMDSWKKDLKNNRESRYNNGDAIESPLKNAGRQISRDEQGNLHVKTRGKSPEEWTENEQLIFLAETEIKLKGAIQAPTLKILQENGYEYKNGEIIKADKAAVSGAGENKKDLKAKAADKNRANDIEL